jgi:predicted transcriptional regulator
MVDAKLQKLEEMIKIVKEYKYITLKELSKKMNLSRNTFYPFYIPEMKKRGIFKLKATFNRRGGTSVVLSVTPTIKDRNLGRIL